jgi:hypothetical protein
MTDAITTEEQSVSGMKPILTSLFSGASEPAAQAPTRTASGNTAAAPTAPAFLRKFLLLAPTRFSLEMANKKGVGASSRMHERLCSH